METVFVYTVKDLVAITVTGLLVIFFTVLYLSTVFKNWKSKNRKNN